MVEDPATQCPQGDSVPTLMAADLQDHLMTASNDLDRLQRLLADATRTLMTHFHGASTHINDLTRRAEAIPHFDPTPLQQALADLGGAVVALQFQDLASQLIAHTDHRLRSCVDRLARDGLADDGEDGEAAVVQPPLRPNPVTQDEVDAGSITLF